MTIDELASVEAIVDDFAKKNLPVFSEVVPLKSAIDINGLRAVFGEKYPDPVRIVSIGQPVSPISI
jgi:alanyl-tRNA synthetase